MEWPDNDFVDPESPAVLDIVANPGTRVSFGTTFLSSSLRERFTSSTRANGREYTMSDFSIRIDVDTDSPTGFSLDIGRDQRDMSQYSRMPDAAGASAQLIRPLEGSHFTAAFQGVSQKDMAEFIGGISEFLKADAEMDRLNTALKNRTPFNISHPYHEPGQADKVAPEKLAA